MGAGWNYRIIYHPPQKRILGNKEIEDEEYYGIHEVYYDGKGEPEMYAIKETIYSDTKEGLREVLDLIELSLKKEVINVSHFE